MLDSQDLFIYWLQVSTLNIFPISLPASPWEIPRIEQPDGLQSMGLQRAGHDWATEHARNGENQRHKILEEGERTAI